MNKRLLSMLPNLLKEGISVVSIEYRFIREAVGEGVEPPVKAPLHDAAYWQKRGNNTLGIGHVFKYPYSYYDLLRRAGDPELRRTLDAKAYHLF